MTEPTSQLSRITQGSLLEAYQRRLEESGARGVSAYDQTFDNPPAGIGAHEIDANKIYRRVNQGELNILGYTRERMIGRPVLEFIVMTQTAERAMVKKMTGELELKPFVRTFIKADGSPVTLLLLDRLIRVRSGAVTGICTVLTEVAPEH